METSRRGLLKLGSILGLGSLLPGCARESLLRPAEEAPLPNGEESTARSVCGLCPAGCGLGVRKVDGRAVGVWGLSDHPINQGALCPRGAASLQELYHPDRLKTPLVRAGEKGQGRWKALGWDEALRLVSEKLAGARGRIAAAGAPAERGAGRGFLDELLARFGGRFAALRSPAGKPLEEAFRLMHGTPRVASRLERARLVLSFGFDWLQSHPSPVEAQRLYAELRRGPAGRAGIVQVEPRFSVTAAKADAWLPVRPGADGVFALGLVRAVLESGAYDQAFVAARTAGFEEFRRALEPFTAPRVSEIAGVPEKDLRLLALRLINERPAAALASGDDAFAQLAAHSLNAVAGSIGEGRVFSFGRTPPAPAAESDPADADVLLLDRVNPVLREPARWRAILRKARFVVAVGAFADETTELADLVLPCRTALERLHASVHSALGGREVVNAAPRAVAPLHDARDPGEIYLALARPGEDYEAAFRSAAGKLGAEALLGEDAEAAWVELPEDRSDAFRTSSGRFDFGPMTRMIASRPIERPAADSSFPLDLYVFAPLALSTGDGAQLPFLRGVAGPQGQTAWETWAELHPETAARCGVADGELVRLESPLGRIEVRARVVEWAAPGVVSVPFGLGRSAGGPWLAKGGANPMELTSSFSGAKVSLERA